MPARTGRTTVWLLGAAVALVLARVALGAPLPVLSETRLDSPLRALVWAPSPPPDMAVVFAVTKANGLLGSRDGGATWTDLSAVLVPPRAVALPLASAARAGGATSARVDWQAGVAQLVFAAPRSGVVLAVGLARAHWLSRDWGAAWTTIATPLAADLGLVPVARALAAPFAFHPSEPGWILGFLASEGCTTAVADQGEPRACARELWVSGDSGANWERRERFVVTALWVGPGALAGADAKRLARDAVLVARWAPAVVTDEASSQPDLLYSPALEVRLWRAVLGSAVAASARQTGGPLRAAASADTAPPLVLVSTGGCDLLPVGSQYVYLVRYAASASGYNGNTAAGQGTSPLGRLALSVTKDGTSFVDVALPTGLLLDDHAFALAPMGLSETSPLVRLFVASARTHGVLYLSNADGLRFSLALRAVRVAAGDGVLRPEVVAIGLDGVLLANRVVNLAEQDADERAVQTVVSFTWGALWRPLVPPATTADGTPIVCTYPTECTLNLAALASLASEGSGTLAAGVGVVLATGAVGSALAVGTRDGALGTFLSRDAGVSWIELLQAPVVLNVGNSGSLLLSTVPKSRHAANGVATRAAAARGSAVAFADDGDGTLSSSSSVSSSSDPTAVSELQFSWTLGGAWQRVTLASEPLSVGAITARTGGAGFSFIVWGTRTTGALARGTLIHVSFAAALVRSCTGADLEEWLLTDATGRTCVLGMQTTYLRRKRLAACADSTLARATVVSANACPCSAADWECDYGYERLGGGLTPDAPCVRDVHVADATIGAVPLSCRPGLNYTVSQGYRRLGDDRCDDSRDGDSPFSPRTHACPVAPGRSALWLVAGALAGMSLLVLALATAVFVARHRVAIVARWRGFATARGLGDYARLPDGSDDDNDEIAPLMLGAGAGAGADVDADAGAAPPGFWPGGGDTAHVRSFASVATAWLEADESAPRARASASPRAALRGEWSDDCDDALELQGPTLL